MKPKNIVSKPKTPNSTSTKTINKKLLFIISFLIIVTFWFTFKKFFPTPYGRLGQDYFLFMPKLLDGAFWYKTNGLFAVPWFTPSFGGGLPAFPDPQSMYYSVPQFLSFFISPFTAVKLTFILFGVIGFY